MGTTFSNSQSVLGFNGTCARNLKMAATYRAVCFLSGNIYALYIRDRIIYITIKSFITIHYRDNYQKSLYIYIKIGVVHHFSKKKKIPNDSLVMSNTCNTRNETKRCIRKDWIAIDKWSWIRKFWTDKSERNSRWIIMNYLVIYTITLLRCFFIPLKKWIERAQNHIYSRINHRGYVWLLIYNR